MRLAKTDPYGLTRAQRAFLDSYPKRSGYAVKRKLAALVALLLDVDSLLKQDDAWFSTAKFTQRQEWFARRDAALAGLGKAPRTEKAR
jgi:hypothetical protein